ncbi:BLOC-1-related complex subunit 5-like [Ptychodera flava]|uniref:BLOC-1-related complex subunit 5-like n=1 Tax=Ptychodera flava TaxID=63121 RepID=UPI003969D2F6
MGVEQSTESAQQDKRPDGQDVPYTSYSVSRDSPKHTNDSPKTNEKLQSSKNDSPSKQTSKSPSKQAKRESIIVVREAQKDTDSPDPELAKMQDIPTFVPIMRGALNIPNMEDPNVLDKIDSKLALVLCLRYQEHFKQCAEAVSFDQHTLTNRIKEVDQSINTIMASMTDRQKKFAKYAEHIQKVEEMSAVLKRVQMSVDQLVPLMERLNSVLPDDDRLEAFSMRPEKKVN